MSYTEWVNLQEAMVLVFGNIVQWLGVLLLVGAVFAGVIYLWMALLRRLTR